MSQPTLGASLALVTSILCLATGAEAQPSPVPRHAAQRVAPAGSQPALQRNPRLALAREMAQVALDQADLTGGIEARRGQAQSAIVSRLDTLWRAGALEGRRSDQAYFVRCDTSVLTSADVDAQRIACLIGLAVRRPAEFELLRILRASSQ